MILTLRTDGTHLRQTRLRPAARFVYTLQTVKQPDDGEPLLDEKPPSHARSRGDREEVSE